MDREFIENEAGRLMRMCNLIRKMKEKNISLKTPSKRDVKDNKKNDGKKV